MEMCGEGFFFYTESSGGLDAKGGDMIVVFKKLLDRHMEVQGIEGYGSCAGR